MLLKTFYDAYKSGDFQRGQLTSLPSWTGKIARLQGHHLTALVLKDEHALVYCVTQIDLYVSSCRGRSWRPSWMFLANFAVEDFVFPVPSQTAVHR